jgi:hypothetical protein
MRLATQTRRRRAWCTIPYSSCLWCTNRRLWTPRTVRPKLLRGCNVVLNNCQFLIGFVYLLSSYFNWIASKAWSCNVFNWWPFLLRWCNVGDLSIIVSLQAMQSRKPDWKHCARYAMLRVPRVPIWFVPSVQPRWSYTKSDSTPQWHSVDMLRYNVVLWWGAIVWQGTVVRMKKAIKEGGDTLPQRAAGTQDASSRIEIWRRPEGRGK